VLEASGISEVDPLGDPAAPTPKKRPRKPERPRSRGAGIVRGVLGVALIVGVSTGVAWAARRHVLASQRFAVSQIEVTGARHRTNEEIAAEAGLAVGSNVFTTDLEAARARLLTDPWISDASLARRLPGTVLVQVTEREAGAVVALGETYLATRDGDLFKKLEAGDLDSPGASPPGARSGLFDLPIVTGLVPEKVNEDKEGTKRMIRRGIDLASDYRESALSKKVTLQEIHFDDQGGITLIVGKAQIALQVGVPPFRKKLDEASRVLAELEKRGAKPDVVMLDNEARPERVVARVK
jgi:cell division protein FtsQ